jgi:hypothetical protein
LKIKPTDTEEVGMGYILWRLHIELELECIRTYNDTALEFNFSPLTDTWR